MTVNPLGQQNTVNLPLSRFNNTDNKTLYDQGKSLSNVDQRYVLVQRAKKGDTDAQALVRQLANDFLSSNKPATADSLLQGAGLPTVQQQQIADASSFVSSQLRDLNSAATAGGDRSSIRNGLLERAKTDVFVRSDLTKAANGGNAEAKGILQNLMDYYVTNNKPNLADLILSSIKSPTNRA